MEYDLHIHTHHSSCSILKASTLLKIAKRVGLNGIAVADHNSIKGGVEVSKLNKDKDFEVIPSIEVNTDRGHVLGLYVNKDVKPGDFFEVSEEIRRQGGIAVMAHPFRMIPKLRSDLNGVDVKKYLDAVECYNARTSYFGNRAAVKFAEKNKLAKTGGSDSHFSFEIGRSRTIFEGDLTNAIKNRKTRVKGSNVTGLAGSVLSFFTKRVLRRW
ncbi:MAG: PHP domain-containing protein [Nanoarchaeota archaeon]|nr:PHP domain-containing protein [Nanoarchaeota archaeon]MBU1004609.1 PHP domain-containing protein [Nanoarchaeota archaeon]MBU1945527.1 PHP domain-containing protein [Nanoarchaeota archaeon]